MTKIYPVIRRAAMAAFHECLPQASPQDLLMAYSMLSVESYAIRQGLSDQ